MNIAQNLIEYTVKHSNFETKRNYISLSHIALSVDEIVEMCVNGFEDSENIRLKCYKGYQMERDLLCRLKACFEPGRVISGAETPEINPYNGLVKGHPDFWFDGYPGDFKSVLKDDWLPDKIKEFPYCRLPHKVVWQMQGYMLFSNKDRGYVVYESRETGLIADYTVYRNINIQRQIEEKLEKIVERLKVEGYKVN